MAIVEAEKVALGPFHLTFVLLRLLYVQNDRHSILIVVPYQPFVRVCCIRTDEPRYLAPGFDTGRQLLFVKDPLQTLRAKLLGASLELLIDALFLQREARWWLLRLRLGLQILRFQIGFLKLVLKF